MAKLIFKSKPDKFIASPMPGHRLYLLLTALIFIVSALPVKGQSSVCPANIDFEQGNLSNWECRTGRVESVAGVNTVTWEGYNINTLNHKIIDRSSAGTDPYGGFSEASPNGSKYSVKLGNNYFQNISAEGMFYTFRIPDTATVFSILFYYAVVFQDPQHNPDEQPRFRTSVFNVTDNEVINCSNFDFTASASLPGFRVSPVDNTVIYKDWTPVTLNLSGYAGKTIRLEFITSDCTFKGHFGYAYIDVNSNCSGAITGNRICENAEEVTLVAPHGFQSYSWYSDQTYSTVISTSQSLVLNPAPSSGTTFPVVVGPYPGFGCPDTIDAVINKVPLPSANAGPDAFHCIGQLTQLGSTSVNGYGYSWLPPSMLINPASAEPIAVYNLNVPTTFYLTVTDSSTGCRNYDTVTVTPVLIDTSLLVTGDTVFCQNKPVNTVLRLQTRDRTIQWFENNTAVSGATGNQFIPGPFATSTYKAVITKGSCFATTREVIITRLPVPRATFTITPPEQCLNGTLTISNKSVEPAGITTNYNWKISDGRSFSTRDISLAFSSPGQKYIYLKARTTDGCADSTARSISISDKCGVFVPTAFTPGDDGKNDLFRPAFWGVFKLRKFAVYDRNGVMVFFTKTIGEGWDGRHKGKTITTSVLVWTLEYEDDAGRVNFQKGTVTLIR